MSNHLPLLPPHVIRGLLESGQPRDLDLPKRVAEWVTQVLIAERWMHPVCMGRYGLTDQDVMVRVDVDVIANGRPERTTGELAFRDRADFAPTKIIETMTRDMAELGVVPRISP